MNAALLTLPETWHALRVLWICWSACLFVSPHCGFLDSFSDRNTEANTYNSQTTDSFWKSFVETDNQSDVGNVTLNFGAGGADGAGITLAQLIPLVVILSLVGLGALFLTRR